MSEEWFKSFRERFIGHLRDNHADIVTKWDTAPAWTQVMSEAVAAASTGVFGPNTKVASRGRRDGFKCEYLSIDCTVHNDTWDPPILMVELENDPRQLEYATWKLLCARPNHRLLIGYFFQSPEESLSKLQDIARRHPTEAIHFLLAPWARPSQQPDSWLTHYRPFFARGEVLEKVPAE